MAFRPYTFNITRGRQFYGTALPARSGTYQSLWTNQQQAPVTPTSRAFRNTAAFGIGLGTFIGSGFIKTKTGNIWDKYLNTIRSFEEYSPGGMARTLQLSNFFSPYSSAVREANLHITPELLNKNTVYSNYLSQLIGIKGGRDSSVRLLTEGVTLRGNRLFWGQGSETALKYASALTTSGYGASQRIGAGYAQLINTPGRVPFEHFFAQINPSEGVTNPLLGGLPAQIIGGHTLTQAAYRKAGAIGTELVGRFNRLLTVPFENKFLQGTLGKVLNLGVEKSGGLRMLGKLSAKYGLALGGVVLGYQSLDYLMKRKSIFKKSIFSEGLTTGIGTAIVKANLAASRTAEVLGLHRYREKQEEIAPGSTDIQKLLAFPLIGSFALGVSAYGAKTYQMFRKRRMSPGPWGAQKMPAAMARREVEQEMAEWGGKGLLSKAGHYLTSEAGIYSREDLLGRFIKKIATPNEEGKLAFKLFDHLGPIKLAGLIGAGIGLAATLPFLPGALIPGQRPNELRDLYSGRKEVAVRKGRWWSLGRTPWEGDRVQYFRPNWYARMRIDAREKSIWGDKSPTPLAKWFKREFTYDLEKKHYEDRPYPITALPFEDVPLIGPILANTIGRLIKPPKLMHTDEWLGPGGSTKADYGRFGTRYATELGEQPGGAPISPYAPSQVVSSQIYRMTQMVGLPGWLETVLKEKLTGSSDWFDQSKRLESARRIDGMERWYTDQNLGDMFMTNEAFRRLYPHKQNQVDLYNPIRNTMPTWLPGPGDKSPDFLHGDPYTKVQEGELRLPGKGLEARYPELKGVKPEDYPDIYKFKVLADVAPYSNKFGEVMGAIRKARAHKKTWSTENEEIYQTTIDQIKQKKESKTFHEYKYLSPMGELFPATGANQSTSFLASINQAKKEPKPGILEKAIGGYWELLSHNAETSLDMLTPFAPGAKLIHQRSAIEDYERERLYGTESAFWQRPLENFIYPFARTAAHELGFKGTPSGIQKRRDINQYFDILKYVKNSRLSNQAAKLKDWNAVEQFGKLKDQTLFGLNPFTRNYESIMKALPKPERDYFDSFEHADTKEERQRILEMVPENEKSLYIARWKLVHADEIRKAKKQGILSNKQIQQADRELDGFYKEAKTQGFSSSKELFAQYSATRLNGETYADWYRRTQLMPKVPLPGADWVGWHPSVDLDDIKLKVVQTLGEDMHDYDLWESREKQLPYKPYLNDDSIKPVIQHEHLSKKQMKDRISSVLNIKGLKADTFLSSFQRPVKKNEVDVTIEQDRQKDMHHALSKMS